MIPLSMPFVDILAIIIKECFSYRYQILLAHNSVVELAITQRVKNFKCEIF
jgi:hemerythrin superfamily protein